MEIIIFLIVSIGVIVTPGPNVLVVVSTSISHGKARGLQTVAGTSIAMIFQLVIAALATSWFVTVLANGFVWLKWFGVAYLFYLGLTSILSARNSETRSISAVGSFRRGFLVSLTNPKTIIFFSAFIPQFIVPTASYYLQIIYLSGLFWFLALVFDSCYAVLASKLVSVLKGHKIAKFSDYVCGFLYIGTGSALAVTKNG